MNSHLPHVAHTTPWDEIDLASADSLLRLSEVEGPCVTFYLHTSVFGPDTRVGPSRLRTQAREAAEQLAAAGIDHQVAADLLEPLKDLESDPDFWQSQGPALALFTAPTFAAHLRLPVELAEEVAVGPVFRLRPLVPLLSPTSGFLVLALAQNAVRLLHGTREGVREVPLGAIPASMDEAIPQEEMERHGQSHSTGRTGVRGEQQVHGQGNEADYDKAALERYFRAVDEPLVERFGSRRDPLVLASVGYYLPIYRRVSRYPALWDAVVEGNPEHRTSEELHAAAWQLVAADIDRRDQALRDRFQELDGTGRTAREPVEVLVAAQDGRVDTLFVDPATGPDAEPAEEAIIDKAIVETVRHRGRCVPIGVLPVPGRVAALLRF
jgi:hypothetical protein